MSLGAIQRVELAGHEAAPSAAFIPAWAWVALGGAAVLVLIGAGVWALWERRRAAEDRAFDALAWRLRLGPRTRRALRGMARVSGMPAVALLLSEEAFATAARQAAQRGAKGDGSASDALRARLFRAT